MKPVDRFYEWLLDLEPGDFRARKYAAVTRAVAAGFLLGWLLT